MARAISSFNSFTTETSNVRDVSTRLLLLEPDRTPLYVLTNNSKRKVNVFSPRIEYFHFVTQGRVLAQSRWQPERIVFLTCEHTSVLTYAV